MTTVMKSEATPSDREVLTGLVERVTYQNAESGYCVLRIKARGHRELITLVGHAAAISAGEWATATGNWVNDRTHGQQFKARFLKTSAPTSAEGIEKYLASGMIRGIGPVYAKKLLRAFGEKVFDIIEAEPDRLRDVDGIGPVRAGRITAAWAEQKVVREIMIFLHSHGVGTARAVRIYKTYGGDAVQVIETLDQNRHAPVCQRSMDRAIRSDMDRGFAADIRARRLPLRPPPSPRVELCRRFRQRERRALGRTEQASGRARCRIEGEFGFARASHEVERACGLAPASDLDLEGKGKDRHRKRPARQFRRWRGLEPRAAAFVVTGRCYRGDRHNCFVLEREVGTLDPGGVTLG
jgi:ATP-dependent exoDNAse (exonuclease V) alpha subunit